MNIKDFFRLNLETGMGNRHGKRKHLNSAEFWAGSLKRWDGRSYVLVLGFGVGFEGASSGSAGLCSFLAILWSVRKVSKSDCWLHNVCPSVRVEQLGSH
jgi:hypothetical protein